MIRLFLFLFKWSISKWKKEYEVTANLFYAERVDTWDLKILHKQCFRLPSSSAIGLMLMKCNEIMHIIHTRVDVGSKIHSKKSSEWFYVSDGSKRVTVVLQTVSSQKIRFWTLGQLFWVNKLRKLKEKNIIIYVGLEHEKVWTTCTPRDLISAGLSLFRHFFQVFYLLHSNWPSQMLKEQFIQLKNSLVLSSSQARGQTEQL